MKITSLQNNFIKELANLKLKKYRDEQKLFLVDDIDLIEAASKKGFLKWILTIDLHKVNHFLPETQIIEVTEAILDKLADVKSTSGVIGVCSYYENIVLDPKRIVALDGVQDPGNSGAIVRSAHAFNFDQVLLANTSVDLYNPKYIRASKGSCFAIACQRVQLYEKIKMLKKAGYQIMATALTQDALPLEACLPLEPYVLVVGSEGQGISAAILSLADVVVKIPINADVESLNVSVASAICMHYLNYRR